MIVYEVNVDIDDAIRGDYLAWLGPHVAEIVALPGFTGAEAFEVDAPEPGRACFCMRFALVDDDAHATYLREHAPRLRADGIARFGERMRATRRVMRPVG